ncbi:hypothetical protein L484_000078 [Morus notabilis]|uniref:DUF1685 family protein n=1 Tax=Morus notabilis TaxID=981085 RepID=W9S6F5_9ROSA|nr:uncharacterized protein LOC21404213 [Morus notabilis]XP_010113102.1 uncharacterized protein LOC21383723 [Morus notabilis]EXB92370.1 hypothetical protein L484_021354 [Morus notabilis]EXC64798.1 hypothetical protein L484_000078 [Morus notabilis]
MAADEVLLLNLFDSHWFGQEIIATPKTNPISHDDQLVKELETTQESISSLLYHRVRSLSDHHLMASKSSSFFSSDNSLSPSSVLAAPSLQTIFSRKEVKEFGRDDHEEEEEESVKKKEEDVTKVEEVTLPAKKMKKKVNELRSRRTRTSSKSLPDLEFEELKGFMDLGFVFTEEECKDSRLVSMIPGLQRFCKKCTDGSDHDDDQEDHDKEKNNYEIKRNSDQVISRPYLSEAWDVLDLEYQRKKEMKQVVNLKIPTLVSDIDMKDQLRFWAHTVASTVR